MRRRKTSSSISRKRSKQPASSVTKKISKKSSKKKSSKKSVPKIVKKPSQRASRRAPGKSAPAPTVSEKPSKQAVFKKDKRPILVPLDFSDYSEEALEYAAYLAECLHAPMVVLHVVHDPGDAPGYYRVKGRKKQLHRLEDVARDMLDEFMAKIVKRHSDYTALKKAKRMLVTGLPVARILEVAERLKPKMLVMGSAGRTGLSHILLGSKAEQLLRMCPFPVTIVKVPENQE